MGSDATRSSKMLLTQFCELLLVALAGDNVLLGCLGLLDGLLESHEPAIALRKSLGLERVLVSVELEVEGNGAVLAEIGRLRLLSRISLSPERSSKFAHTKFKTPAGVAFSSACLTK